MMLGAAPRANASVAVSRTNRAAVHFRNLFIRHLLLAVRWLGHRKYHTLFRSVLAPRRGDLWAAQKDFGQGRKFMRIAVVGAGGVGGGFGAALAKAGADVTFIARGAHLAAMQSAGLKIQGPRGDTHLVPTKATDDPAEIGTVDIVLFCVKLWDVESAGERIKPLIGPGTAVIPLQNGIDAPERLIPILGESAVMGGVAQISASITAPGVITQVGTFMRMIFGEFDGKRSQRAENFLALCQKAGFDATLSDQILTDLWMKFVLLATNASITALARQPIGQLRDDPDIRPVFIAAHQEVIDVARARGVTLPANALDKILEFNSHAPPTMKASMALDLERGNRLELPWLGGKVAELGRQLGVATPTHSVMYAMLKPYVMGKMG
jgi:2-dehydropantoate 2-reductase